MMNKDEEVFRDYATPLDLKERRAARARRLAVSAFWFFGTLIICGAIILIVVIVGGWNGENYER